CRFVSFFFFSSRRRHTRFSRDWSSDVCSSDLLHRRPEVLAVEEPLEIHLDGVLVATTMRTPGHDFELAAGFCHTEGLLAGAPVRQCRYCGTGSARSEEHTSELQSRENLVCRLLLE